MEDTIEPIIGIVICAMVFWMFAKSQKVITRPEFERMANEYSEVGHFTDCSGATQDNSDLLIEMYLDLNPSVRNKIKRLT